MIASDIHVIRGGLRRNMEQRWDGVPNLADAMQMLKAQVARTPSPQGIPVDGVDRLDQATLNAFHIRSAPPIVRHLLRAV
ncbi:hypothetical protein [Hyphomicrobium sp.]|uniref:hypothetical protein n=1 Tax=Hyphomicrobium sp. TaxID=82 RepID=UPI003FA5D7CB